MLSQDQLHWLSIAVLVAAGLSPLAAMLADARRYRYTSWGQYGLYLFNRVMTRVVWRATVKGRLPLEDGQGGVIVSNHRGPMDPGFVALTTNRSVRWMVAREYCEHPLLSWAFRRLECIPVSRGGIDTKSTRTAIRHCQSGGLVGMFPEGRINDSGEVLLPGRPGAAMVALKARVPVVPCYVENSPYDGTAWGCFLMTAKATLTVGRPIDLSPYYGRENERDVLHEITTRMLAEIAKLAGVEDYQPRLAGRKWKPVW